MSEAEGAGRRMFRDELRALPALVGRPPAFDTGAIPADPQALFVDWFREAVDAGSAQDFLERGAGARAVALAGRSSTAVPAVDAADLDAEIAAAIDVALRRIESSGHTLVDPGWRVWCVHAASVEFWQAHPEHRHVRVRYQRAADGWTTARLWP